MKKSKFSKVCKLLHSAQIILKYFEMFNIFNCVLPYDKINDVNDITYDNIF